MLPIRILLRSLLGDDKLTCDSCSSKLDDETNRIEWTWNVPQGDNSFVKILNNDRDVSFHYLHSSGTAVVRGTEPMSEGQHFWEIAMISPVYGTDMMVGIGTSEADISQLPDKFVSRLGKDNLTWGFSYTGSFHHNGESHVLSSPFDEGSIIGLHLDMWNGTLSCYKNRKHLGIVSRGLKGKILYAMASSTAACSGMRILQSCSFPSSLQFMCCVKLRDLIPDDKCVLDELELPPGLSLFLKNNLGWFFNARQFEKHPLNDQIRRKNFSYWEKKLNVEPSGETSSINILDDLHDLPVTSSEQSNPLVVGTPRGPITFYNHNRHQTKSRPSLQHVRSDSPELSDVVYQSDSSDEDFSDQEDVVENDVKRRKYNSYNYAMGLSDPESDSDF